MKKVTIHPQQDKQTQNRASLSLKHRIFRQKKREGKRKCME